MYVGCRARRARVRSRMHRPLVALLLLAASSTPLAAQHFHRLPATPGTVAYGYYSAEAPPRDSGRVSSNPPGIHAGNMDNKELVAGATLFIPVHAAGALFEIGDGHAAQGDGEVDQTAIETSLTGRLQLIVRKDMRLTWPRAETPTHFIAMGMDKDLTRATEIAVQNAIDFVAAYRGWSKMQAYRLVSVACDVRVTELVDGNVGVHVMIPKSIVGR